MSRDLRSDYNEQYPFHCQHCEGWGGTVDVHDPFLTGSVMVGNSSPDIDDCEHCLGNEKCPRCGSDFDKTQDDTCSFCDFELGVTEGKPYPHSCFCHELENEIS